MSWTAFEQDKAFVTEALKNGDFDYVEVIGAVEETRFFQMLLGEGVLHALAETYPTPRKKEEVPLWLYLASELTLRLHGAMGFGAYPYILHCGGLLDALRPGQVENKRDPDRGEWRLSCKGYNRKNQYARSTPCDKDYLRKMGKDTNPRALERWFGSDVVRQYKELDAFDSEGIFLADGSYLFVPLKNENYEKSSVLLFDENNHPIDKETYEKLPKKRQQSCQWRRCYRCVTLSHTERQSPYSLRCGVKVMEGKAAECPQVWPLAKRFVDAVGRGVMKLLIYDRGLIDGKTVTLLKKELGVDSLFPLKKNMDLWEDAKVLAENDGRPWERYDIPKPKPRPVPAERPDSIRKREAARQKTLAKKEAEREAEKKARQTEDPPPPRKLQYIEYKWIDPSMVWTSCKVPVAVLLLKNHYADGETLDWALASTKTFPNPFDMYKTYALRQSIEEDYRQEKCFWDFTHFRCAAFSMVVNRIVFVELAYSLIQIFLRKVEMDQLIGKTRQRLLDSLLPQKTNTAVYHKQRYGIFDTYELLEFVLSLKEGARRKALGKTRKLRRAQVTPPELPWRPQ